MPHNPFHVEEETTEDDGPETLQDRVGTTDPYNWVDVVAGEVVSSLKAWGKDNGYSAGVVGELYNQYAPQMFDALNNTFNRRFKSVLQFASTVEGMQTMVDWALNWFGSRAGLPLTRPSTGGGGSGSGRRGPTAQDIRNQFDIKELTAMVNEMNRAMVFEEHPNAKRLAQEYVDAIVATKGEKKIDFATFVEERISSTARFKSIYRRKPEHLSWQEYMGPYLGAAQSVAAPDRADELAIGAAQFGASPDAFRGRLQREQAQQGATPFIQGLEQRMNSLAAIFKG